MWLVNTETLSYVVHLIWFLFGCILLLTNRSKFGAQRKKPVWLILIWKQISALSNITLDQAFMLLYVTINCYLLCLFLLILNKGAGIDNIIFQVGSADHHIHYFDLRKTSAPVHVFRGHRKAVSYVKFLSTSELASASTDSTLRLWDVKDNSPVCAFKVVLICVVNFIWQSLLSKAVFVCHLISSFFWLLPFPDRTK